MHGPINIRLVGIFPKFRTVRLHGFSYHDQQESISILNPIRYTEDPLRHVHLRRSDTVARSVSQRSFLLSAVKEKNLSVTSAGSVCSTPPRLHNSILQPTFSYTDMHYYSLQAPFCFLLCRVISIYMVTINNGPENFGNTSPPLMFRLFKCGKVRTVSTTNIIPQPFELFLGYLSALCSMI